MEKLRSKIVLIGISILCMLLCVSVFVVAQNAVAKENNSESKQELSVNNETKPAPKVDSTTTSSITLSWDAVPGAAYYAVATQNDDGRSYKTYTLSLTGTTYTITGLEDSKTYKCLVQAYVNGKWTSFSDTDLVQATTKGTRPVVTAMQTGDGEVTLTWEAIEGAENYVAYEVVGSTYVQIGDILPFSATSVVKDNLANDYEHTFLVQAKVGGQWSKFSESNYVKATPKGTTKPTLNTPTVSGTTINLSWNKVPGAAYYAVATQNDDGKSYTTYTSNFTGTTYSITGLEDSKTYKCLVQANINGKWSSFDNSDLKQATTKGTRPVVTAKQTGDGEVTLTWEAIEGAQNYVAYEIVGSQYLQIGDILPSTTLTVTKDNLANDYEHTFLVQAKVGGQWSKFSERNYAYATPTGTTKPTLNTPTVSGTTINLSWNKVPGAAYYAVATQNDDGKSYTTYTSNFTGTTYSITGLEDSKTYKCLVQANINGKWSSFNDSDLKQATTKGTRPVVTATPSGDGKVKLTWEAIENAQNYVAYEIVGSQYLQIGDILPSTTLTVTKDNLANDYEHTFLVQAKVGGQWSKFSERNYAYATPTGTTKPTLNTPTVSGTTINLSWNKVPGAEKYAVATKIGSSGYTTYTAEEKSTSYSITNLEESTTYDCLVQAYINGKWSSFDNSDLKQATTKGTRPVVTAKPSGDGQVTLTWEAVEGAQNYMAFEVVGSSYIQIGEALSPTTLTITKDNLANDYEHVFLVRAKVGGVWSAYSEKDYAKATPTGTTKPTLNTPTVSGTTINLSWNKVPGAEKYAVATKIGSSGYTTHTSDETSTNYTITGLEESTTYDCLVQAYINGKWSSFDDGDLKQATTKGTRPVTTATPSGDGEVTLTWEAVEGAQNYAAYEVIDNQLVQIGGILPSTTLKAKKGNLANDYEHTFLVRAKVGGVWSAYSEKDYAKATPTGTTKPKVTSCDVDNENVVAHWNYVPGAIKYAVALQNDDGSFTTYTTENTANYYYFWNLESNKQYKVLVQAYINGKWSSYDQGDLYSFTTGCSKKARAVYSESYSGATLKLYYDNKDHSKEGEVMTMQETDYQPPWASKMANITNVNIDSSFKGFLPQQLGYWFWAGSGKKSKLNSITGLQNLNTSNAINMSSVFLQCDQVTSLDCSGFTTSKATDMSQMFYGCSKLTSLNLSSFRTANVTNLFSMFCGCSALTDVDMSGFDTSKATDMRSMFRGCNSLKTLKASLNPSSATSLFYMFSDCEALTSIDTSKFNTSKVTDFSGTFQSCKSLTSLDVSNFDTSSATTFASMFSHCESLTSLNVSKFNTKKVTDFSWMFAYCKKIITIDCSSFSTENATTLAYMFANCEKTKAINVTHFNTSKVTDMSEMFRCCYMESSGQWGTSEYGYFDISSFSFENVTSTYNMFNNCGHLSKIYCNKDLRNLTKLTNSINMFDGCPALVGGAGTKINYFHVDKSYACVDLGPTSTSPGYFTAKA